MLTIDSLDVSIKSVRILRGVALSLPEGQLAGLIGRNGAGKTTLMRTIMGALTQTAGTITLGGEPLRGVPAHARARRGVGYMPEDRRIIPQLTVEENLLVPAWATHLPDAAARLARIYRMIPELQALRERKGLQLSGGQQKLAALGRALMTGTRLLLRNEGLSVILSESDLSHSRKLLDVVFHIDRGQVTPGRAIPARAGALP